jgi:hypothetical protein
MKDSIGKILIYELPKAGDKVEVLLKDDNVLDDSRSDS